MNNKKAQVTIFIIIGAIVLLSATLYFVLNQTLNEDKPGFDVIDVSLETRPTFELVNSCLEQVSLEGLKKLGKQGGWIEFTGLTFNEYPYISDVVNFPPNKIAYWRHLSDCGNNQFCEQNHFPPLCKPGSGKTCYSTSIGSNSIQEQLENYVEQNIDSCLNNFESLSHIYNIQVDDEPKIDVTFAMEETVVKLTYPITIKSLKNSATKEIDEFAIDFDIKMTEMYDLAKEILEFEQTTNFYEEQTMNLVTIYSGINEKLPPTSEVSFFDAGGKYWLQYDIKELLEDDLLPFMGTIRYMNAKNYYPIVDYNDDEYSKYSQGMYMGMNPKIGNDNKLYDFNVIHHYTYAPIYSRIGDGSALLKPSTMGPDNIILKMTGLFLKDYRFDYDIRYPLVVTVNDDTALNGEGFDFNFAVEVNIRNNIPAYNNFSTLNLDVPFQTGLADFEVRLPQNITFNTYDKYENTPLNDVDISYICGREYEVGTTRISGNDVASFTSQLPYCEMGGFLKFTKRGFAGISIPYDNKINGTNQEIRVDLWPLVSKEIIIRKITPQNILDIENAGSMGVVVKANAYENLSDNETVIFSIEKTIEQPYDELIPLVGFFKYQQPGTTVIVKETPMTSKTTVDAIENAYQQGTISNEEKEQLISDMQSLGTTQEISYEPSETYTVDLAPGFYNVDATLIDYNGIQIPESTEDPCPDGFVGLFCDEDPIVLPAQNFSMWLKGGYKDTIEIPKSVIYSDKKILIYVLEMPIPHSWDDLNKIQDISDYQEDKFSYVIPKFIN